MPTVHLSLPDYLKAYVEAEVAETGYASASECIGLLVLGVYQRKHQARIEELLLKGLDSGRSTPMTPEDWENIEREGLARLAEERLHAYRPLPDGIEFIRVLHGSQDAESHLAD